MKSLLFFLHVQEKSESQIQKIAIVPNFSTDLKRIFQRMGGVFHTKRKISPDLPSEENRLKTIRRFDTFVTLAIYAIGNTVEKTETVNS